MIILLRFEQAFINSMIRSMVKSETTYFWIGLQDFNNTGEYFWLSTAGKNSSVSYTNWNKYEPREYCANKNRNGLDGVSVLPFPATSSLVVTKESFPPCQAKRGER